jgi:hypothetical protein
MEEVDGCCFAFVADVGIMMAKSEHEGFSLNDGI